MDYAELRQRLRATQPDPSLGLETFQIPVQPLDNIKALGDPIEQLLLAGWAMFQFAVTEGIAIIAGKVKLMPDGDDEIWDASVSLKREIISN